MAVRTQALREIARMQDPAGVLSLYVDAAPQETAGPHPRWDEQVRVELERLRRDAVDGVAVRAALLRIEPALERILDPRATGRGRALFAALSGDELHEVSLALPLVTQVRLGPHADVLPLLCAVDGGRPTGLAAISSKELRLVEVDQGEAREVDRLDVAQPGFEWSLRKEPNAGVIENERRIDGIAAAAVERSARSHGWDAVVVAGNAHMAHPLAAALREHGLEVWVDTTDPAPETRTAVLARLCAPHADEGRRRHEMILVERVLALAVGGGRGALGLARMRQALTEGRVAHLVLDAESISDADVAGELIGRAFETDAEVTVLAAGSPHLLAPAEGIGGLLRW